MSARELWDELLAGGGWPRLSKWRSEKMQEGLYIDFKTADWLVADNDVRLDDRKNLAKECSGFGNLEGGLIVYGADTIGKPEVLNKLPGVTPLDRYAERLRELVKACTIPPIPGVDVKAFENPDASNLGVVVVYVPFSDGGPYRAVCSKAPDVTDRYFMRQTSDSLVMPHQILGAMFGRRPPPRLRVGVEQRDANGTIWIRVKNNGQGAASGTFVRLNMPGQVPDTILGRGSWSDRRNDVLGTGWNLAFAPPPGELLYPGEARIAGSFRQSGGEREISVRIDCANALPVELTKRVTLQLEKTEWFEPPEAL